MYLETALNILHSSSTTAMKEHESHCTDGFTYIYIMAEVTIT